MYALCGMPVIVYSGAAMADFVRKNKCAIIIEDLNQIPTKVNAVTKEKICRLSSQYFEDC